MTVLSQGHLDVVLQNIDAGPRYAFGANTSSEFAGGERTFQGRSAITIQHVFTGAALSWGGAEGEGGETSIVPVPEPASLLLVGSGLVGIATLLRKMKVL